MTFYIGGGAKGDVWRGGGVLRFVPLDATAQGFRGRKGKGDAVNTIGKNLEKTPKILTSGEERKNAERKGPSGSGQPEKLFRNRRNGIPLFYHLIENSDGKGKKGGTSHQVPKGGREGHDKQATNTEGTFRRGKKTRRHRAGRGFNWGEKGTRKESKYPLPEKTRKRKGE